MAKWHNLHNQFVSAKRARSDDKTVRWYEARLRHWLDFVAEVKVKPKKVRTHHLDQFAGRLKKVGLAYRTRQGTMMALKSFLRWVRKHKKYKHDPFVDFEPLRKERSVVQPIHMPYALEMIRAAERTATIRAIRDAAIMRLLLTTGARRIEIVSLQLTDCNLVTDELILTGKFAHQRRAFLKPTTRSALTRWLNVRPDELSHQTLFVATNPINKVYRPLRPVALNQIVEHWRVQAGLPDVSVSPHKWRHRFATDLAKGKNPFGLQMLLGHTDITISNIYVQSHPDDLRELVERYAPDTD